MVNKFLLVTFLGMLSWGTLMADEVNNPEPSPFKQENPDTISNFSLSVDMKTRHTWRGGLTVAALNFQPTMEYTYKNLTVGAWSVYAVDASYAEIDLYVSYKFLDYFSISVFDYFCPSDNKKMQFSRFFDYKNSTSPHLIDVALSFDGTKRFPISLLASTWIYGADKDENGNMQYSTYFEAGYSTKVFKGDKFGFVIGGTPFKSYYSKEANIVNLGFKYTKEMNFFKDIKTPVYGKMILNPYTENLYLVFGITI